MKRNIAFLFLGLSILMNGCSLPAPSQTENTATVPTQQEAFTQEAATTQTVTQETQSAETLAPQEKFPVQKDDVNFTGIKSVPRPAFITAKMVTNLDEAFRKYFIGNNAVDPAIGSKNPWDDIADTLSFFELGTITDGQFKDSKLYLLNARCDGLCMSPAIYRFAYNETTGKLVVLGKYSAPIEEAYDYVMPLLGNVDKTTSIKALDLPETIKVPNSDKVIKLSDVDGNFSTDAYGSSLDLTKIAFTDSVAGNVYFGPDKSMTASLYVKKLDGTIAIYGYNPALFEVETPVMVTWKAGGEKENVSDLYNMKDRGCGVSNSLYYIEDVNKDDLAMQGTTSNGIDLYAVSKPLSKEQQNGVTVNTAQKAFSDAYVQYAALLSYEGSTKQPISFDAFVKSRPILYFQDPFGRWVGIMKNEFKPAAECGKPVIYLYPQKDTDVRVQVGIDRFTETIPDYGTNGWFVRATPESKILNYADGQTYPYLFWEGQSDTAVAVDKGFVVAREDVESFLESSLVALGLTTQERADFKDFWVSRMLDNKEPYFFVSFLGTRDFNKVAPLTIDPKPDTLIRVFMYYSPINKKIQVMPETLSAIPRNGFTVVEWGGTSSVPWKK